MCDDAAAFGREPRSGNQQANDVGGGWTWNRIGETRTIRSALAKSLSDEGIPRRFWRNPFALRKTGRAREAEDGQDR